MNLVNGLAHHESLRNLVDRAPVQFFGRPYGFDSLRDSDYFLSNARSMMSITLRLSHEKKI